VYQAIWGDDGVMDQLNPKRTFINDLFNMTGRGHHDIKNPHKQFEAMVRGWDDVRAEVDSAGRFLQIIKRKDCEVIVKDSNHDRHLMRWLGEQNGLRDPVNAEFWCSLNSRVLDLIRHKKKFIVLEEAIKLCGILHDAKFIDCNTSYVICEERGGGIECSMHGDLPFRAGIGTFAKMGRRSNTGHGHTAMIKGGAYRAGKSCEDRMGYNDGPSSWSDTFILTYPNSKRTLVTIYAGKARA
jgi:hypothetical protein